MSYIRLKKVNGTDYAYFVETINTAKGPRQKVKQYLGRVFSFESNNNSEQIVGQDKKSFLKNLIQREISTINLNKIIFNTSNMSIVKGSKHVAIKINNGFLTTFTINRILDFKRSNDLNKDAHSLANYFVQAGLTISEEEFVNYYQLL